MNKITLFLLMFSFCVFGWNKTGKTENINNEQHIPKIIHYVWLGAKELPQGVKEAISTWEKYQPDFQIKRWDEENCDINSNPFVKEAYNKKAYNFASDYCRVKALQEGGIYFDTDMILKAPIAPLLDEPLVLTIQLKNNLSASFMAVVPNHPFVQSLKNDYENRELFLGSSKENAPTTWSKIFKQVFSLKKIEIKREKGKYHIYHPTILMYDFKGGENIAEHLFCAGSKKAKKSDYFYGFRKFFLGSFALYFPEKKEYFIFQNEEEGYFYHLKQNVAQKKIKYLLKNNILTLFLEEGNKQFFCRNNRCNPFFNENEKKIDKH